MKFTKIALTLFCTLVLFCGCAKDSDVVLKINDTQITRGEFYSDLDKLIKVNLKDAPDELKDKNSFPALSIKKEARMQEKNRKREKMVDIQKKQNKNNC